MFACFRPIGSVGEMCSECRGLSEAEEHLDMVPPFCARSPDR